jgi:hypothetical protein
VKGWGSGPGSSTRIDQTKSYIGRARFRPMLRWPTPQPPPVYGRGSERIVTGGRVRKTTKVGPNRLDSIYLKTDILRNGTPGSSIIAMAGRI